LRFLSCRVARHRDHGRGLGSSIGEVDAARVVMLQAGEVPIPEPGLDELIGRNAAADRLQSTLDAEHGVNHRTIQ